jgi:hypothetical protein
MTYPILNNFNKEADQSYTIYPSAPSTNAGIGSQFLLYTPAVVNKVKVKLYKYNGAMPPAGTLTARLYSSHNNSFLDREDYADTLLAESTDSVDIDDLDEGNNNAVEFMFDDVSLPAGIYFICIWSGDIVANDGYVQVLGTKDPVNNVGLITFWYESQGRWGSFNEW